MPNTETKKIERVPSPYALVECTLSKQLYDPDKTPVAIRFINKKLKQRPILLVSKRIYPENIEVEEILSIYQLNRHVPGTYEVLNIEHRQDVGTIDTYIYQKWLCKRRMVSRHVCTWHCTDVGY